MVNQSKKELSEGLADLRAVYRNSRGNRWDLSPPDHSTVLKLREMGVAKSIHKRASSAVSKFDGVIDPLKDLLKLNQHNAEFADAGFEINLSHTASAKKSRGDSFSRILCVGVDWPDQDNI